MTPRVLPPRAIPHSCHHTLLSTPPAAPILRAGIADAVRFSPCWRAAARCSGRWEACNYLVARSFSRTPIGRCIDAGASGLTRCLMGGRADPYAGAYAPEDAKSQFGAMTRVDMSDPEQLAAVKMQKVRRGKAARAQVAKRKSEVNLSA